MTKPDPTYTELIRPIIQTFEVAHTVGGTATHNAEGSKAIAEILKLMARELDARPSTFWGRLVFLFKGVS